MKIVTVFAFSIENFKRSKSEVDALMDLAAQKLNQIIEKKDIVDKYNVRVRVLGNLDLLPDHVRQAAYRAMQYSSNKNGYI